MIIVKLKGGLGNQLFQYAAARRISYKNNAKLVLDKWNGFKNDPYERVYSLDNFNIKEYQISEKSVNKYLQKGVTYRKILRYLNRKNLLTGIINKLYLKQIAIGIPYIVERTLGFDKDIFNLKLRKTCYIDGYWASEKYFHDIKDIIYDDLKIIKPISDKNLFYSKLILSSNSISLHIRRLHHYSASGKKVDNSNVPLFSPAPLEYYRNAIKYLSNIVNAPHFFIFSDDIVWAKREFKFPVRMTYIEHDSESKDYEELWLMSQCKHNIIANSTFSWWGAWLNRNHKKVVIAPKMWFSDPTKNSEVKFEDLYPKEWIIL